MKMEEATHLTSRKKLHKQRPLRNLKFQGAENINICISQRLGASQLFQRNQHIIELDCVGNPW